MSFEKEVNMREITIKDNVINMSHRYATTKRDNDWTINHINNTTHTHTLT